jgi:hypothetical protein
MQEAYAAQIFRAFRQAPWRKQMQTVAVWSIALLIVAVLGGLYLAVASHAGTAGRDLQQLELKKAELIQANNELRAQLAELRSVTRLNNRARELGYLPAIPEQLEFLAVRNYPAAAEAAPSVQVAKPAATTASLGDWLAQTFHGLVPGGGG